MTQTPPKPTFENTTHGRSSVTENRTPATNDSPSPDSLLSFQEQATTDAQASKPLEPVEKEQKIKGSSTTLRRQLLMTILPTVLVPLGIAAIVGYRVTHQGAEERIKVQMQDQSLLVGEATSELLAQAWKIPAMVADNPLVINAARAATQQAEAAKLHQLSIEQVEKRFSAAKLLQPNQVLNDYLRKTAETGGLAEIFFTERNGFNIAYSNPTSDFIQRDEQWWQKGKSDSQWLAPLEFDQSANTFSIDLVQAITAPGSGEFLGVIKSVLPSSKFDLLATYLEHTGITDSQQVQLLDVNTGSAISTIAAQGAIDTREVVGGEAIVEVARTLVKALQEQVNSEQATNDLQVKHSLQELTVAPFKHETGEQALTASFVHQDRDYSFATIPGTDWVAVASIDHSEIEAAGSELILVFALTALVLGAVAVGIILVLSRQLSTPLVRLSDTAEQVASGNLDAVAEPLGTTETKTLAQTFNNLLVRVKNLLQKQEAATEQARLLKDIILKISQSLDSETVFDTAVEEIRPALKSDRVLVYRFDETWKGTVIAESVAGGWPKALGAEIADPCFADKYVEKYKQGRVQATPDIYQAGLTECHLKQLEPFAVKANLVAPILVEGQLLGLLIAHQCSDPRNWEKSEIDFFAQFATQVGLTLERANLLEQQRISSEEQRSAKEQLQKRALDLLMEVDPVSRGDLTIRARVTEDEIGTVADSYNSTIESLRKIVTQVQAAAKRVAETTNTSEASAQSLSAEAVRQAEEISAALERIQAMNYSARTVVANAEQAEAAVKQAAQTVEAGDAAMNQTVDGILAIQGTVSETAKKVKRLGESSQNISQVVNRISRFAAQTHWLALKASIEAARAGEEGQGFAVIADEVRSLAAQSAQATAEIETLTASIQSETNEVAAAMEAGTEQVAVGTKLVEETRQSLNQIAAVSTTINQLVEAIAQAAVEQSQASQAVTQTMADVAAIAGNTSTSATNVSASFRELLAVAQELQESVSQFKVK